MGPIEQSIIKQALRAGKAIPERIKNAPVLNNGLELYLKAFFDLDTERATGFSIGRIPFSAVAFYATYYRFDELQSERLLYFIRSMDAEYCNYIEAKNKTT